MGLVSFVFYQFILLIKGTRAMQILFGLMFLTILLVIAPWIQLLTVIWILEKILPIGLLGLLIIFQPELRRGLEQIGRGSIFGSRTSLFGEEEISEMINEVTKAAVYLSKRKIGALIVFTRTTGLENFYGQSAKGLHINAKLKSALLCNIFMPHAPLHDGAVIVDKGRIEAAGCLVPLSENPHLDKALGSRHHAAIGVTEVSDAVAVVVSEETGTISVTLNGKINRGLDSEGLERNLRRILKPMATPSILSGNWHWRKKS